MSGSVLLRVRNVSDKRCRENQNTFFMFSNYFFFENCVVDEIMRKNVIVSGMPQMKIWGMSIACWIPKATSTHSEYGILIAFPRQQWLRDRA
jgi:hypothetical protein